MRLSKRLLVNAVRAKGWRFSTQGRIDRVLKCEEFDVPFNPNGSDLLVKMIAAPITRADVQSVQGSWAFSPTRETTVAGLEGVGEVIEVGSSAAADGFKKGDRVVPIFPLAGTWATHANFPSSSVVVVPKDIEVEYAALMGVAPVTAANLLLRSKLEKGDWVVQNGSTGTVGGCVIAFAKHWGLKTLNVVRQRHGADDAVERLLMMGGDLCVTEDYLRRRAMTQLLTDDEGRPIRPTLALNSVGGRAAAEMARLLARGGTFRTYGSSARKALEIPVSSVVHNDVVCDGFFLPSWLQYGNAAAAQQIVDTAVQLAKEKKLFLWSHRFGFNDFPHALAHAFAPGTGRKAILRFEGSPSTWNKLPDVTHSDIAHAAASEVATDIRPRRFDPERPSIKRWSEREVSGGPE